jgi:hypothetical protein
VVEPKGLGVGRRSDASIPLRFASRSNHTWPCLSQTTSKVEYVEY